MQVILYDDKEMRAYGGYIAEWTQEYYGELDATPLEDDHRKIITIPPTTAKAIVELRQQIIELDPTTMKRIAKYNLDKDFEELNHQIKSAEDRLKLLAKEMETKEKKLEFMQRTCQQIWNDDCFDEDDYAKDEDNGYDDYEEDEWE